MLALWPFWLKVAKCCWGHIAVALIHVGGCGFLVFVVGLRCWVSLVAALAASPVLPLAAWIVAEKLVLVSETFVSCYVLMPSVASQPSVAYDCAQNGIWGFVAQSSIVAQRGSPEWHFSPVWH